MILYGMRVPVAVLQVRLRTAISVYTKGYEFAAKLLRRRSQAGLETKDLASASAS